MMNTKARRSLQKARSKHDEKEEVEILQSGLMDTEKRSTTHRCTSRERKTALQHDVDKLKKRLRHEENVHRALERAFTRPLGTLPRFPTYLPAHTLELLAEVAILEEEIVRLEEKVVRFRQGLYREAVYFSCSKPNTDISVDLHEMTRIKDLKTKQLKSSLRIEANSAAIIWKNIPSLSDETGGEESQSSKNSSKNKKQSPNSKLQAVGNGPIRISESILKCLMNIFLRMSPKKNSTNENPPLESVSYAEDNDPYNLCSMFGERDIGPYKHLHAIEATSIDPNRTTISVFLVRRLKLLFHRLATINLKGLSHREKLAFWINMYNSCMMNAFIEYGIPESPERVVELMQKATLNVGGYILNAITIEHFILRRPYHSKYTFLKGTKYDEMMACNVLGLELSEPSVTFALSCGSWSSPAVRVYTASQVENELETAKRDYLQAAIGISSVEKFVAIPKLLDWYLLDFAKDFDSLLDWICVQLPTEIGKEVIKCLEKTRGERLLQSLQIMPYEFRFRYIFHT